MRRNALVRASSSLVLLGVLSMALSLAVPARGEEATAQQPPPLEPIDVGTPERIEVSPAAITLDTNRRTMHVIVSGFYADGRVQDLTRAAAFSSSNEAVVKVEGAIVRPVADGQAEITVEVGGHAAKIPVDVKNQAVDELVSFNYGTLVALSKQGCNSGACHGSPSGKAGFRLSLRGYDPVLDALTLVRESLNRRTNVFQPEDSLLLRKPLMQVAHGGGRRLRETDASYIVLRDWIRQGCQLDPEGAAVCTSIEVHPTKRELRRPAHTQQLLVLAHYSDGTTRDVTSLACYDTSDPALATASDDGLVVGLDRGEAAVLVRYLDKMATSSLTFLKDVEGFHWNDPPENNYVDHHVFAKLRQLQILPSDLATDSEFVRRVYLDVLGMLPTAVETEAFLADSDPQKRAKLIDTLLERPEYAEFWAMKWGDVLRLRGSKITPAGVHKFHRWLVASVRDNMPYDQFARDLLLAEGSTYNNPAANYYRTAAETNDCTETTCQLFLGVRIGCAKCHNHPFERWTQDNYYGLGAFFNRVQRKQGSTPGELVVWMSNTGEVTQPRTGKQIAPWVPGDDAAESAADTDRRQALVEWLTKPANPFFARVAVNRIWGHLFGRGIVEPVDDFRDSNPPASRELLDELAQDFAAHGFDRKHVMRTILNSRAYQLSSRTNPFNAADVRYFSHAASRLMTAEQLLDAICQVSGVTEKFPGLPAGTRATELPSPDVENEFLKMFGQPARETACECERTTNSSLAQALQMINGPLVHAKVRDEKNRLRQWMAEGRTDEQVVQDIYLAAFCRKADADEMGVALKHIAASGDRTAGLEDVLWAVLNANEFLFQH